jgi:hypothetical protein
VLAFGHFEVLRRALVAETAADADLAIDTEAPHAVHAPGS